MIYAIAWWTLEREQPKLFAVCHITEAENLMLLLRGKPHLKFICPAVGTAIMILPPGCVLACACLWTFPDTICHWRRCICLFIHCVYLLCDCLCFLCGTLYPHPFIHFFYLSFSSITVLFSLKCVCIYTYIFFLNTPMFQPCSFVLERHCKSCWGDSLLLPVLKKTF